MTTYGNEVASVLSNGVDVTATRSGLVKLYVVGTKAYILSQTGEMYANPCCREFVGVEYGDSPFENLTMVDFGTLNTHPHLGHLMVYNCAIII